ncbi:MAG: HAMP domain-containing protein [Candidatus Zixiibacteriota bacterium]|nr:MAG: HAMP domain-containing protein [candidate division Zixibacteria bacterium]
MNFTLRIRLYLLLVALVPPLTVLLALYLHSAQELENMAGRQMQERLLRGSILVSTLQSDIRFNLDELSRSEAIQSAVLTLRRNQWVSTGEIDVSLSGLDFFEILDSNNVVLTSYHRPGLIGERPEGLLSPGTILPDQAIASVEYDVTGRHAALTYLSTVSNNFRLYAGGYLTDARLERWSDLIDTDLSLVFVEDSSAWSDRLSRMARAQLYQSDDGFEAILAGSADAGYYLVADFRPPDRGPLLGSLMTIAGSVALASVIIAVLLGIYISGRAKREVDNLLSATARVAEGDFNTPVMAYEEGEFAQLADSVSEMMTRLKESQRKLITSEKIAAWEAVGRKIAHEIKNPLTPISISTDDIRRSYAEKLPDFEKTLADNCSMIKDELARLTRLLDEFVGFARMRPPEPQAVPFDRIIDEISSLFSDAIKPKRLTFSNTSRRKTVRVDPEQFKQILLNLVKNSLESGEDVTVAVKFCDDGDDLVVSVEDSGPGFPEEQLENEFQPYVSTKTGGSGLGLVICQRIVVDHGGRIELYNLDEGGAGVKFSLPQANG